jgi:hypothetical protein
MIPFILAGIDFLKPFAKYIIYGVLTLVVAVTLYSCGHSSATNKCKQKQAEARIECMLQAKKIDDASDVFIEKVKKNSVKG